MNNRRAKKSAAKPVVAATPRPPLEPVALAPTEGFKEAVFRELQAWEEAKRAARRIPEHTTLLEFRKHLYDTLNALYREGRIRVGDTFNDKYIITTARNQ